ncbi:riboflavin synthase [candidate division GN15 bacterium]|uniref:Riboflavin synthase n=1 Tax=candidate division GN15 bacterium TaxID=2072418 RepID=A0A855X4R8_9BACT|nr:MAG: riboflavin synthase [candidate division GN15 bacterium]
MFTGLVETIGRVGQLTHRGNYLVLTVAPEKLTFDVKDGDSICCDGACLTVAMTTKSGFVVEASQVTVVRTTLGRWPVGYRVHLERALRADSRLGGHFVTGHVDCIGTVEALSTVGESQELNVRYDGEFDPLVVSKGSVAINGVSLTVNEARKGGLSVNLIPYTLKATTLASLGTGDYVNIEFDILGKYIAKQRLNPAGDGLTMEKLLESGW